MIRGWGEGWWWDFGQRVQTSGIRGVSSGHLIYNMGIKTIVYPDCESNSTRRYASVKTHCFMSKEEK